MVVLVAGGRVDRFVALGLLASLFCIGLVQAVDLNCTFKASCSGSEVGLLRAENDSGGYNNAHIELMNDSGTNYSYTLCCDTDVNHTLNNSCSHENRTIVIRINGTNDTHAQEPGIDTYVESVCMALSPGNLTCEYVNTTCSAGYSPFFSMASSESNGGLENQSNAHLGNYTWYTLSVCCQGGNARPSVPILQYPLDGNDSVFERNITFDWQDSTDPDGDEINYTFNLSQATCPDDVYQNVTPSTYTSGELCVDQVFWWKVKACDPYGCSAWSDLWNFTIASVIGVTFDVNNTDFGSMARNTTDNTTDNTPPPFEVNNTGNVKVNVTFKADDPLYDSEYLDNSSFQYKAREYETNAYASGQETWTNVSDTLTALFTNLHYTASHDAAYVDILVDLPYNETAGYKSSIVNITASYNG